MKRYIMTGAPGRGKTSILRALAGLGHAVVAEAALAHYLGHPVSAELRAAIARITAGGLFERQVFFVQPIGFCQPTPARQISYQDSLAFGRVHQAEYLRTGFDLVNIPAGPVQDRAAMIDAYLKSGT